MMRQALVDYEKYLSTKLSESETFFVSSPVYNFTVKKVSRMDTVKENVSYSDL